MRSPAEVGEVRECFRKKADIERREGQRMLRGVGEGVQAEEKP